MIRIFDEWEGDIDFFCKRVDVLEAVLRVAHYADPLDTLGPESFAEFIESPSVEFCHRAIASQEGVDTQFRVGFPLDRLLIDPGQDRRGRREWLRA